MQVCSALTPRLSLRTLLPEAQILGTDDLQIGRCVSDWRQVEPGDLFAALGSDRDEGGTGIPQAIARGAAGVVCQGNGGARRPKLRFGARQPTLRQVPGEADVPLCLVPNAREAYGRICQALAGNPSLQLKVIGIAGDNGKTTTSCLLASVLLQADWRVGLLGSLGYLDGQAVESATQPTPPADALAVLLARMVANGCSHAVVEVSRRSGRVSPGGHTAGRGLPDPRPRRSPVRPPDPRRLRGDQCR